MALSRGSAALCAAGLSACLLFASRVRALPDGFTETDLGSGWNEVAGLAFSSDGSRLYVVERGGKVWIMENGVKLATPFLDISDEVGGWRDFGLLGFALHPNFEQNGYVYALYVVDRYYLFNHGTPGYSPSLLESEQFHATIGRISRFTADPATGFHTILPGSQLILVGATPQDGIPITHQSHGTGQLTFGQDGTLLATDGDGASYDSADSGSAPETNYVEALNDGILKSWENVGAWRSQLVGSYSGKVLRIDPLTGAGIPSNPWYDPANPSSPRSRTFAVGLRNPYRFSLRPGTGSHDASDGNPGVFYIGDVGWNSSEDLQILNHGGQNFGWPAFEGMNHRSSLFSSSEYWDGPGPANGTLSRQNPLARNPLGGQAGCNYPFLRFRDLIDQESRNPSDPPSWPNPCDPSVQIPDDWVDPADGTHYHYYKFVHSRPPIAWRANALVALFDIQGNPTFANLGTPESPVAGTDFAGNASTGGVWYTGSDFPAEWRDTYFHGDYGAGWIKSFGFDSNDQLVDVVDFLPPGNSVTFIATNPVSGGIYYVKWNDRVRRIRWVGTGNTPPTAVATPPVAWSTGGQLSVAFTGSGSSDPDAGAMLSYHWDFGDGGTSDVADPSHVFHATQPGPQSFGVRLSVTDEDGNVGDAQVLVALHDSPPSVQIDSPVDGSFYSTAAPSSVSVRSSVSDPEQGPGELACRLEVELVHNNHTHPEPAIAECQADVTIDPVGCDGNYYAWRFTLTVTDPQGLETRDVSEIHPDCTPPVCGDGVVEAPEQCDPPGDCCTAGCTLLPDFDHDGVCDALDPDDDGDGIPDAVDNCPFFASTNLRDTDGDGRGDVCECTDQNGDGRNDVRDIIAISQAIFDPKLATPLCDGNGDGKCDVGDIIAVNSEIYSPGNTSTCSRQPVPEP